MNGFLLIEMRRFFISISTWLVIIYAAKAEKETVLLPISILQKLLELMPQKKKCLKLRPSSLSAESASHRMPKGLSTNPALPPISILQKLLEPMLQKKKNASSCAPHLSSLFCESSAIVLSPL